MSSTNLSQTKRIVFGRLWWVGPLAAAAAAVANVIVFMIEKNLFGLEFIMPLQPGAEAAPLTVVPVIVTSVIPAIAATILFAVLGRFTRRPILIFQIIALLFLIVSFGGPLNLPVDAATKAGLGVMHIGAWAAIVGVLTTLGRKNS
jgi:hypothetical protein